MSYREVIYQQYASRFQASGYARADVVHHWTNAYRWYLRDWLPADRAAAILDVGCGGGQMLMALQRLGYTSCAGVDISPEQVERGRAVGLDIRLGGAVEFLAREQKRWDVILGIDILEHLTKDEALEFISAARTALKPGGRLILQMPNPAAPCGMAVRYGDLTHEISLAPDCIRRLLRLFDFEAVECRETGPVPGWKNIAGWFASFRFVLWWAICRPILAAFDVIETSGRQNKIYTRVYLVTACQPTSQR